MDRLEEKATGAKMKMNVGMTEVITPDQDRQRDLLLDVKIKTCRPRLSR